MNLGVFVSRPFPFSPRSHEDTKMHEAGPTPPMTDAELQRVCEARLRALSPSFREAPVEAAFHPYVGLTHTLRRRSGRWKLRISDLCRGAPEPVVGAIAELLGCRVLRRRPPEAARRLYEAYRRSPEVRDAVSERKLARGRKEFAGTAGRVHSLKKIFARLNERHFNGQLEVRHIGWGKRRSRVRLGHYDPVHQTIAISPLLDSADVPGTVVEYLVYHEMLHILFSDPEAPGRRVHHPAAFRQAERGFPGYREATRFLARMRAKK